MNINDQSTKHQRSLKNYTGFPWSSNWNIQNIKGNPPICSETRDSSEPGTHPKSASKPSSANGKGQLLMRAGMPSLQSGIPWLQWPQADGYLARKFQLTILRPFAWWNNEPYPQNQWRWWWKRKQWDPAQTHWPSVHEEKTTRPHTFEGALDIPTPWPGELQVHNSCIILILIDFWYSGQMGFPNLAIHWCAVIFSSDSWLIKGRTVLIQTFYIHYKCWPLQGSPTLVLQTNKRPCICKWCLLLYIHGSFAVSSGS
jgi:hypothetical protein